MTHWGTCTIEIFPFKHNSRIAAKARGWFEWSEREPTFWYNQGHQILIKSIAKKCSIFVAILRNDVKKSEFLVILVAHLSLLINLISETDLFLHSHDL